MKNPPPSRDIQQEEPNIGNEPFKETVMLFGLKELTLDDTEKLLWTELTRDDLIEIGVRSLIKRNDLKLKVEKLESENKIHKATIAKLLNQK